MRLCVRRIAACLLSVLGPVLLCGAACRSDRVSLVQVKDLGPESSGTQVRVQGTIARFPSYDPATASLSLWVDDGTGQILVALSPDQSRELIESGRTPTVGDRIACAGVIRIETTGAQESVATRALGESERVAIERSPPQERAISEAVRGATDAPYGRVLVQGQVREVWHPYEELTVLRIQDETGQIDVVYDQDLLYLYGAPTTVFAGDLVRVQGVVVVPHGGEPQIVLDAASGLTRLPADAIGEMHDGATPTPASSRGLAGAVEGATPTPAASRGLAGAVEGATPTPAASRGLAGAGDAATPTPAVSAGGEMHDAASGTGGLDVMPTGQLAEALVGQLVKVEARIEQATLFSSGCRSVVDDGSGPAVIWMLADLYGLLVDPEGWNVGAVVRVTGRVAEYEDELEIIPQRAQEVVMVQRAPAVVRADTQIGSLSGSDVGRRVTVEATIVAVDEFSSGAKCVLDDGSGQVTLLLWQDVFDALADKSACVPGRRVRASGWVDEYYGELEIIAGLAYDVMFLEGPNAP